MEGPEHLIDDWRDWPFGLRARPAVTARLPSETNSVYQLSSTAGSLVLRVNSVNATVAEGTGVEALGAKALGAKALGAKALGADPPGVDRVREAEVLARISGKSFFNCRIANKPDRGYLVMTHLPGVHPPRGGGEQLEQLGQSVAQLQQMPVAGLETVHPATRLDEYARLNPAAMSALAPTLDRLRTLDAAPQPPVICHFDLLPPNLLVGPDGWTFLDWEFAAGGDPLIDLATLIEGMELRGNAAKALLAGYGQPVDSAPLLVMRAVLRTLWLTWRWQWHGTPANLKQELGVIHTLIDAAESG